MRWEKESDIYFLKEESYSGAHPNFFNPENFPWIKDIEGKYDEIVKELEGLIAEREHLPPNINPPYLSSPDAWRNLYFMNFRWYNHANCLRYPKTFNILRGIPNLCFAGITVLEPHSRVLPHIGETNATIRCHFGLRVPGNYLDCGIMVNGEKRGQRNGKVLMFSDAHLHTAWNDTDEKRVVIVFDVVQNQFADKALWVCAQALGALTVKFIDQKVPLIKPLSRGLLSGLHFVLSVIWLLYLPVQKQFRYFYRFSTN
jgi:aspartyl/asparaginyl beta-hydroxylase (cupin superfamily)